MSDTYYYIARSDHQPGELLGAGHFGRGYRRYPYDISSPQGAFNGWKVAKELIFERVRTQSYPLLPSRLECSYAFLNREDALRDFSPGNGLFAFEVLLTGPLAPSHVGDFSLLSSTNSPSNSDPFIPWAEAIAHSYWSGQAPQLPELLTLSPIKVIRRIG